MNSAALLDLLGNENRRRILRLLARKPCYVTEMSEYLGVSPKAVIDHLAKLEEAGLVESRVDDRQRKYFHIARNVRLEVEVSPYRFGTKSAYPASVGLDLTRCRHLSVHVDGLGPDAATEESTPGVGAGSDRPDAPESEDADQRQTAGDRSDGSAADSTGDSGTDATDVTGTTDPAAAVELADHLRRLERLEEELSLAQRWVQGRLTDVVDRIGEAVERQTDAGLDGRLYADVLVALEDGDGPRDVRHIGESTGTHVELVEEALAALSEAGLVDRTEDGWRLGSAVADD